MQLRLVTRLVVLYLVTSVIIVGVLVYHAYDTADTLNNRELSLRTTDLARYVSVDPTGVARLNLPQNLEAAYNEASGVDTDWAASFY
ncbi:hypothetical protein LJR231_003578 [Phyllobacterium sp. LjRoot231]|uniref:hypothetical protein n=1 Tax=Phyllobacterium sp. LjRoot231 TaxID=3342289 RepID=UPI003ECD4AAE